MLAPILPVSRYSTMSGAISVESMRTRTGASVSLRIWRWPLLVTRLDLVHARADLAGVEVLDDVRRDQRGEHEDADGRVRVVADLEMAPACYPARSRTCSRRSCRCRGTRRCPARSAWRA